MSETERGLMLAAITRRRALAGAAGLGAAALLGANMVQAQDPASTPSAGTDDDSTTDEATMETTRAEAYQDFLGKVATNLGIADSATVDTAIRDALKAMVDDRFTAGEISANAVTELQTWIDETEMPITVGFAGPGGRRGGSGGRIGASGEGEFRPGKPGGDDSEMMPGDEDSSGSTATPTT